MDTEHILMVAHCKGGGEWVKKVNGLRNTNWAWASVAQLVGLCPTNQKARFVSWSGYMPGL